MVDEVERQIRDDVRHVSAGVGLLTSSCVEHRILIHALAGKDFPFVEAGRVAAKMPLADHASVVAALLQQTRDGHARAVEPVEHRDAVEVRILASQDCGTARRADGIRGEDAGQERALARQAVEVRRRVDFRPVRADGVRRVVVGHDEDDVGTIGAPRLRPRTRGQEGHER